MPVSRKKSVVQDRIQAAGSALAEIKENNAQPILRGKNLTPYMLVPINQILPNPKQPRRRIKKSEIIELAQTIRTVGVLQPLVITPGNDAQSFVVVAGHRRWKAAKEAGLSEVPAIVRETLDLGKLALIENLQRSDLAPLDEAEALKDLIDEHNYTHERAGSELGKKRTWVSETLSLCRLPESIKAELIGEDNAQQVSKSVLIEITRQGSDEKMLAAWEQLKKKGMTVRAARVEKTKRKPRSSQFEKFLAEKTEFQERVDRLANRKLENDQAQILREELKQLRDYINQKLEEI